METTNTETVITDDQVLAYTQDHRKKIVDLLFKEGVPEDTADMKLALLAMDGMDKAALGKKRIIVDSKTNANQEMAAGLIAKLLTAASNVPQNKIIINSNIPAPVLGADIPDPILVEGEMDTLTKQQTYDSFILANQD